MNTTLTLKDNIDQLVQRAQSILSTCKAEYREKTAEEEDELKSLREEINDKKEELKKLMKALDDEMEDLEKEEPEDSDEKDDEECKSCGEDTEKEEDKRNKKISIDTKMEKRNFSLLKTVRSMVQGSELPIESRQFVNGMKINLPTEQRAYTVASEGEDLVVTDILNIVEPLMANNVLADAGATFYTGLVGDVQIPVMSAQNVKWAGETADASDGSGAFTHVTLSPKRLTAYVDISNQFLIQDSVGAEAVIRKNLIEAIQDKFEATIFGAEAGSATQPAGLFADSSGNMTTITDYDSVVGIEAALERLNVKQITYVVSPEVKAVLRAMTHGAKNNCVIAYQNGEFDGAPVLSTSHIASKKMIMGNFKDLAIGAWDNVELIVDPYTKAASGQVRIVINAYFDCKAVRPTSFKLAQIS